MIYPHDVRGQAVLATAAAQREARLFEDAASGRSGQKAPPEQVGSSFSTLQQRSKPRHTEVRSSQRTARPSLEVGGVG